MGLCASRAAYLCAVRQKVLGFQREVLLPDGCAQSGEEDVDRDQLASLLQALAVEPAVPRKTARVVRFVT